MDLRYLVMQFVNRVRKSPADGSDPRLLGRLEKVASESFDGAMVALHAPISEYTWEVRTMMLGASAQPSPRIPLAFPAPVEIVGMLPLVVITSNNALVHPTTDDIDVAIDVNQAHYKTSGEGITSPTNASPTGQFVSLSHLSVLVPRLWMWKLNAARPEMGFTFRWKQAAGTYEDAMLCVGIFGRLTGGGGN